MTDSFKGTITFHGSTPEFIELLKRQADDPESLTKQELQMIAQGILAALETPKITPQPTPQKSKNY